MTTETLEFLLKLANDPTRYLLPERHRELWVRLLTLRASATLEDAADPLVGPNERKAMFELARYYMGQVERLEAGVPPDETYDNEQDARLQEAIDRAIDVDLELAP